MSEEEKFSMRLLIELIYGTYGSANLNIAQMSKVIGVSKSKTDKMFSEKGEKFISKHMLLPEWNKVGTTRLWFIVHILSWLDSEKKE